MYNIFVVEDETIVSLEIQGRLQSLGYNVCGSAASGEEALEILNTLTPDLALLDIRLKGKMTGIDVAKKLHETNQIPYLFLTSHSDQATLEAAKVAYPFGYLLKPVDEYVLRTNIEITMYRHELEKQNRRREKWLYTTLQSIGDGVITTDERGKITFMNPGAEEMTGWGGEVVLGKYFPEVIEIMATGENGEHKNPAIEAIRQRRIVHSPAGTRIKKNDGTLVTVQIQTTPIIDETNELLGAVILFRKLSLN